MQLVIRERPCSSEFPGTGSSTTRANEGLAGPWNRAARHGCHEDGLEV